jgi:hypothetical protein
VGTCGEEAGAIQVKAVVKILQALRRRRSESEPARKQRPARAGAAPREGKALEGENPRRAPTGGLSLARY